MRVCITSQGDNVDSDVDPRFGRCQYFIFMDTESDDFQAVKNPNMDSMGGAGIQSGQVIAEENVKVVLTGNVGPNAFKTLSVAGVEVIIGVSGKVSEAIEKYKKGELKSTDGPSVDSHFGTGK
ncbi:MAG: dinitrogenase iron-molybdenum cofactor biosynthesis protein [Candidatus Omnitrophica bacterium]|nr:dinitrogenase iron-molybdenum cofactor biosynthesis protein [Candidatus Omnitrophota bacterium]